MIIINLTNSRKGNCFLHNIIKSSCNGQITIFLTIIFIGVLFLSGILIDAARIITGKTNVVMAVEDACTSSLALYNSQLKTDYGIFALSENDKKALEKTIEIYINENLNITTKNTANNTIKNAVHNGKHQNLINLYDFKIEKLNVTPINNLTNNLIVKEQILKHMKLRAPKQLGGNIFRKLNIIKDVGDMALSYEKKTEVEKELYNIDSIQRTLKKYISGTLGDGIFEMDYIEKFNLNGVRDKLIDTYIELINTQTSLLSDIESQAKYLEQLEKAKDDIGEDYEENEKHSDLFASLQEAREKYTYSISQLSDIKRSITDIFRKLADSHTNNLITANKNAISCIKKLVEKGDKLRSGINELTKIANFNENNIEGENNITEEFQSVFIQDLNNLKELVLDYEKGYSMINTLENNIFVLNNSLDTLNYIQNKVETEDINDVSINQIKKTLSKVNDEYKTIEFSYQLSPQNENSEDPRKNIGTRVKEVLTGLLAKGLNIQKKDINFNEMPSRKKVEELNFDEFDVMYMDNYIIEDKIESKKIGNSENKTENIYDASLNLQSGYDGDLGAISDEIDLVNVKSNFTKNAIDYIFNIGKSIGDSLIDMRDNIYISQYIIDNFDNKVDKTSTESTEPNKETDQTIGEIKENEDSKEIKERYNDSFQAEVEYILHGSELEQVNVTKTMGQLTLLRFGINTLQIYMDAAKRKEAYGLASAIAGWWTGGAGIPIIANLILCSWGMVDGMNDVKLIMQGESLPIFKKTDIEFSYRDYLLLFLMQKDGNIKIDRIQDLIELNIRKRRYGFKMGNTHSSIRVEAEISMKYLFVTRAFMPARLKTADGRHKINVLLYEGY